MAQILVPVADQAAGSWGSTPLWSKVDDDSTVNASGDGTTITSDNNTNPDDADLELTNSGVGDPGVATGHVLRARWSRSNAGNHGVQGVLQLWQGVPGTGTLIATLSSASPLETSEVEDTYTLSAGEANSITDYNDLYLRLRRSGGTGGSPGGRESLVADLVEFEIPDASGGTTYDETGLTVDVVSTVSQDDVATLEESLAVDAVATVSVADSVPSSGGEITVVGTAQFGAAGNGGDVVLTLDGSPAEDDVIIIVGSVGDDASGAISAPSGNNSGAATQLQLQDDAAQDYSGGVWALVVGSTPDTTITMSGTGSSAEATTANCLVLRGVDTSTIEDATATKTGPSSAVTNPDLGSITTASDGAFVILGVVGKTTDSTISAAPTGYTDGGYAFGVDTRRAISNLAYKEVATAAAEDPGAYSGWDSVDFTGWTIAIRPAGGSGGTTYNENELAVDVVSSVSQTHDVERDETGLALSLAAGLSEVDEAVWLEAISAAAVATVNVDDVAARLEQLGLSATAGVSVSDELVVVYDETGKVVAVVSATSVADQATRSESLSVAASAGLEAADTVVAVEFPSVGAVVTVTVADDFQGTVTEAVTAAIVASLSVTDVAVRQESGSVGGTSTVSITDDAVFVEGLDLAAVASPTVVDGAVRVEGLVVPTAASVTLEAVATFYESLVAELDAFVEVIDLYDSGDPPIVYVLAGFPGGRDGKWERLLLPSPSGRDRVRQG